MPGCQSRGSMQLHRERNTGNSLNHSTKRAVVVVVSLKKTKTNIHHKQRWIWLSALHPFFVQMLCRRGNDATNMTSSGQCGVGIFISSEHIQDHLCCFLRPFLSVLPHSSLSQLPFSTLFFNFMSPLLMDTLLLLIPLFCCLGHPLFRSGVSAGHWCAISFSERSQEFSSSTATFSLTFCFPLSFCRPAANPHPTLFHSHHMSLGDWQPPQRVRAGTDGIWMAHSCMKKVPRWRKWCRGTLNCKLSMTKSHCHPSTTQHIHCLSSPAHTHFHFNNKGNVGVDM